MLFAGFVASCLASPIHLSLLVSVENLLEIPSCRPPREQGRINGPQLFSTWQCTSRINAASTLLA